MRKCGRGTGCWLLAANGASCHRRVIASAQLAREATLQPDRDLFSHPTLFTAESQRAQRLAESPWIRAAPKSDSNINKQFVSCSEDWGARYTRGLPRALRLCGEKGGMEAEIGVGLQGCFGRDAASQ